MKNLFIILLFLTNYAFSQVQGIWSGTMLYDIRAKTITGITRKTFQLFIQNNQVTGTMTGVDSTIIEGKLYDVESCKGLGGSGDLIKLWIYEDGHYEINIETPEFACTKYEGGYGDPGRVNAAVETKFPAYNLKALKGDNTETVDLAGLGTQTIYTNWDFYRVSDAVLIVTPENYSSWLPEPGKTELSKGNMMKISMKLQDGNGNISKLKATSFKLTLSNTSKEPGITLNMPLDTSKNQLPDLRFIPHPLAESGKEDQTIEIQCKNGIDGEAYLASYDGGGWTTLKVTALLEDHTRITGHLLIATGDSDITIPERDPKSKIATSWLNANKNPAETDDKEESMPNENNGDGFSAYEEYRGVISKGSFKRLVPNAKEVGIWISPADYKLFSEGLEWFKNASEIEAIPFFDKEIVFDRKLNRNYKTAHVYDQYAIRMATGPLDYGVAGKAIHYGGPKFTRIILVDWKQIQSFYLQFQKEALPASLPYSMRDLLAKTVAHELAHGLNVPHHGEQYPIQPYTVTKDTHPPAHIFESINGPEITTRPYPLKNIGSDGNQSSGNLECIMAYITLYKYAVTKGANNANIYYKVPLLPIGRIFCTSPDGKGINATKFYFGNAENKFCLKHFQLKP